MLWITDPNTTKTAGQWCVHVCTWGGGVAVLASEFAPREKLPLQVVPKLPRD